MSPRARKPQPGIPEHIDIAKLPAGIYWDASGKGRWFVFETVEGKKKRRTVAGPDARLSDLHSIAEMPKDDRTGTVAWVCEQYHASPKFSKLEPGTRRDYTYSRDVLINQPTALGAPFGQLQVAKLRNHNLQRLIDRIESEGTPTKANKAKRYASIVFRWALNRGVVTHNPATGLEQASEKPRQRLPSNLAYNKLLAFAKERGQRVSRTAGSLPDHLWMVMELGYMCRLRGIETLTLTEAAATPEGLKTNRRKRSRDSVVLWAPRLLAAWDAAIARRQRIVASRSLPVPLKAEDRVVFLAESGDPLSKSGLDTAWQRLVKLAIAEGIITDEERFSLHDLKRKGGTDAPGSKGERQDALGVSDAMMKVYDKSEPRVKPSGITE